MAATPPLTRDDAYLVFGSVKGTRSVLVGGQAVAVWAELYAVAGSSPFVSRDVDFLGGADEARVCAKALAGKTVVESAPFESIPVTAAKVIFTDSIGLERNVDFLINLCGVKKASDVQASAAQFENDDGSVLYVMDPVTCLRTRIANICQLGRRGAQSVAQATVALRVARAWLVDPAMHETLRHRLKWIESVFTYAHTNDDARQAALMKDVRLDAFDAIQPSDLLPDKFRDIRYPQMRKLINARRVRDARGNDPGGRA